MPMLWFWFIVSVLLLGGAPPGRAHHAAGHIAASLTTASQGRGHKLADLIPGLYGGDGLTLATDPAASHAAHFTLESSSGINRLNEQIVSQIGLFPFSASASGFAFAFDPSLGTFLRSSSETLGPLFAERAPTLGRGKFNLHVSYTFFTYDSLGEQRLRHYTVVARHEPDIIGLPDASEQFELDTIQINLNIKLRVHIVTLALTYGITDRLEVGGLLPITGVDMDVKSRARIVMSSSNTLFPRVHTFATGAESPNDAAHGHAVGFGDVVLRAKYRLLKGEIVDIAGAVLTKLATGDHRDFLGTGATTLRPFLVLSRTLFDVVTPHINVGYEFNLNRGRQNALQYAVGLDAGTATLTLAGELLGSYEPTGDGLGDHVLNAAVGLKWNPWKHLLLLTNAQLPLNRAGLRSDVILTFGAEYSF